MVQHGHRQRRVEGLVPEGKRQGIAEHDLVAAAAARRSDAGQRAAPLAAQRPEAACLQVLAAAATCKATTSTTPACRACFTCA